MSNSLFGSRASLLHITFLQGVYWIVVPDLPLENGNVHSDEKVSTDFMNNFLASRGIPIVKVTIGGHNFISSYGITTDSFKYVEKYDIYIYARSDEIVDNFIQDMDTYIAKHSPFRPFKLE